MQILEGQEAWDLLREKAKQGSEDILFIITGMATDRADALRGLEAWANDMRRSINKHYDKAH